MPASWEGEQGVYEGTISDISTDGCFILTLGEVALKELIKVRVLLPRSGWVPFWGEVINYHREIGFGLRFTLTDRQKEEAINLLFEIVKLRTKHT